jgi:hypothetical protein
MGLDPDDSGGIGERQKRRKVRFKRAATTSPSERVLGIERVSADFGLGRHSTAGACESRVLFGSFTG